MKVQFGVCRVELIIGDITEQIVDAIVNAANQKLAGGGGVDGAIHRAGGPSLMQETDEMYPAGCPTGSAVATSAGNLRAKYVFHAVGPWWNGGMRVERGLLKSAYFKCLELAVEHQCDSVALPAISTGAYRYPVDLAAEDSLSATREFLLEHQKPSLVRFVLFNEGILGAFSRVLDAMTD
jgi:O-acetyl-ADP-ribose deacetylase (regulator of RNase III)